MYLTDTDKSDKKEEQIFLNEISPLAHYKGGHNLRIDISLFVPNTTGTVITRLEI